MQKTELFKCCGFLAAFLLVACSGVNDGKDAKIEADELVFAANPEPVKGKQDVYVSIARAAKYNVDVVSNDLRKRIAEQNPKAESSKIIKNIMASEVSDENRLMRVSRVLEYAVTYATASLSTSDAYTDNYFYENSAKQLALTAIKMHQNAWFAGKKLKENERLSRQEKKVVENLNAKEERNGTLTPAEYDYRKNQEVALAKLEELNNNLAFSVVEYADLVKISPKQVELEGRRFYELYDFDKDYSIDIFQEAAVRNRKEFALAKEQVKSYAFADVRHDVLRQYPLVPGLDINGVKIENSVYEQELDSKGARVAENLLNTIAEFRQASAGSSAQQRLRQKAFDGIAAAILTQVEINYQTIKLADTDYETVERSQSSLKKEIRRLEKIYHPSNDDKLALLNAKITMELLEGKMARLKADRAVALRSLYFNAGLSPLSKKLLKAPIKDIAYALKQYYNRDMIEMMSAVKAQMNIIPTMEINAGGWAQEPDWLEKAVSSSKGRKRSVQQISVNENYKEMQLGSYEYRENADADMTDLSAKFPELRSYAMEIVPVQVNGRQWFRLIAKGKSTDLSKACRHLQSAGYDCLLRH